MKIISILVLFFLTSCVTVPLSKEESKVRVTGDPNVVTNCKFIQAIDLQNWLWQLRTKPWEVDVKKRASKIGANVVFSLTLPPLSRDLFRGEAYHCK